MLTQWKQRAIHWAHREVKSHSGTTFKFVYVIQLTISEDPSELAIPK